jgi:hypothetical protein
LALRFRRAIEIALTTAPLTPIVQRFSLWTVVSIFLGLVAERSSSEASSCLALTIDNRNVGLNVTLEKPGQKLSASVSLVRRQILRPYSELAHVLDHAPRGQHFLAKTCRRCIHRQNHATGRVDEIVVVVCQRCRPTLDRPGSIWIGCRHHLLRSRALFCICHGILPFQFVKYS